MFLSLGSALPFEDLSSRSEQGASLNYTTIFQFPTNGSWIENQAHRPNGNLLVTRADVCELWEINPVTKSGSLVSNFSDCSSASGITKIGYDAYAVITGQFHLQNFSVTAGKPSPLWRVDYEDCETEDDSPQVSLIANTDVAFTNGAVTFAKDTILLVDSLKGAIWKVNTNTGASSIVISDPTMSPNTSSPVLSIGINGIRLHDNFVYYTNTGLALFCRIPIDSNAASTGPAQVLARNVSIDDFTILNDGTAYIAGDPSTFVFEAVPPYANFTIAAGVAGSLEVAGSTSVKFGSTHWDSDTLYVTTSGSQLKPVSGRVEPGKVVAVCGLQR